MPKINRARIINFSYNNNSRHIIDETLDFYGGEDALLNLKNGGGKSVLVQALMQPVLPKTKLMNRRIEDFFKSTKTPCYIMLEWALEDKGGYLLTGIAMIRRESRTTEEAEGGTDLKYFTFTVKYREANDFDIKNISLVKKNKKSIEIAEFKEAKILLDSKKANEKYEIRVFGEDDRSDYRDELISYGISQEEWRSVILNINQTEGGVIEIFDKSKNSQQLLNEWILKSIEKVVNGEEDKDNKKLGKMLENVVNDIISNERFIRDKEILQGFMKKCEDLIEELNRIEECRTRENEKKRDIADLYYYADKRRTDLEDERFNNDQKIEELKAELNKIYLEGISKDYYESKEALEALVVEISALDTKIIEVQESLDKLDYEERLERASREYESIVKIKQNLSSIRLDIERLTGECDEQKKIENLSYTLKIKYEALIENIGEELSKVKKALADGGNRTSQINAEKKNLNSRFKIKSNELSNIQRDVSDFIDYEEVLKRRLSLSYTRNILSEVEKGYFDNTLRSFSLNLEDIHFEMKSIESVIVQKEEERLSFLNEANALINRDKDYAVKLNDVLKSIETYNKQEGTIAPIFEKHNLNWKTRFNRDGIIRELEQMINEKDDELKRLYRELAKINESLECIKTGSFNLPKKLLDFLKREGIQYITGENYLRNLNKEERDEMLKTNPLLPYSLVMTSEQISSLSEVYFDFPVNQMIPLIDYKDLECSKSISGPIVALKDGIGFLCIYDRKIVDFESFGAYEESLKKEAAILDEDILSREELLREYRRELHIFEEFKYPEDYLIGLERERLDIETAQNKIVDAIKTNTEGHAVIEREMNNHKQILINKKETAKSAEQRIEDLKELIQRDKKYASDLALEREASREVSIVEGKIEVLENEYERIQKELIELSSREALLKSDLDYARGKYIQFEAAKEAELIDNEIEGLERELTALQSKLSSELGRLRTDMERYSSELKDSEADVRAYNIPEESYREYKFDETKLKRIIEEKKTQSKLLDAIKNKKIDLGNIKTRHSTILERCTRELRERNSEPIPKENILLNFEQRRRNASNEINSVGERNKQMDKEIGNLQRLVDRVVEILNVAEYEARGSYKVKTDLTEDFGELKKELASIVKEGQKYKTAANNKLTNAFVEFKDKHEIVNNIYEGILPLREKLDLSEDNYYFLGERMLMNIEGLRDMIRICELRLEGVDNSKRDLVQHCYYHGKRIFDEIDKITDNSSIRLEGHNRSIPMLRIDMEPISEEKESKEKIRLYIEDCISQISKDIKAEVKYEDIQKKMFKYMSTKELLNELSELSKAKIYAYKIDININNRGYKTWEQVMKENSGGERFVAFFTVLVALMSYTRLNGRSTDDYRRNKDTKVLIMDNPFGPISSEHLLRPLFQIAKKYNTQLICLTDLKQNSILNCFDLIYMIKIRANVLGTKEYLEMEKQLQPDKELKQDENLEKVVFKIENVEQVKFF